MAQPWRVARRLHAQAFADVRMRAIFDCCKWDPQVGDVATLGMAPLVLEPQAWRCMADDAQALAHETLAAERELLDRPALAKQLGLGWRMGRWLAQARKYGPSRGVARVMRFDFHFTTEGWRISECNSDVPGGFVEAGGFTRLMAEHYPDCRAAADPADSLAKALARASTGGKVVLVHATAYSDDQQVMTYLAQRLSAHGLQPVLMSPDHLRWVQGQAESVVAWERGPIDLVVRFFPGEWLVHMPRRAGWAWAFRGGRTLQCNPASAMMTQSKRLPMVWDRLRTAMPAWRRLLPETRDVREVSHREADAWVIKPALGRVGEGIAMMGVTSPREYGKLWRASRRWPGRWVAQRRFEAVAMQTDSGPCYPCVGVFTVDGEVAGAYGRIATRPLVDAGACDVAVLIGCETAMHAVPRGIG